LEIPDVINCEQATKNVDYLRGMIMRLRHDQMRYKPCNTSYDVYLSFDTFIDLLSKHLNAITLRSFLQMTYDDAKVKVDEAETFLLPLTDIFIESQLTFAYDRLMRLLDIIEYGAIWNVE
jgi:hypothetical protein